MSETDYARAQQRMLDRYGLSPTTMFIEVPAIDGRAQVLAHGEGPPVMMLIGGGVPAAMWAPLMTQLEGFTLYAVDLPGHGLSDRAEFRTPTLRPMMTGFVRDVLDGLGVDRAAFVSQSMGGLFSTWLALEHPDRMASISYVGCPALMLGTSAPFLLRLGSIPSIGRLVRRLQPPSPRQIDMVATMAGEDFSHFPELRDLMLALEMLPNFGEDLNQLHHAAITLRGPRPESGADPGRARQDHPTRSAHLGRGRHLRAYLGRRQAARIIPMPSSIGPGGRRPG